MSPSGLALALALAAASSASPRAPRAAAAAAFSPPPPRAVVAPSASSSSHSPPLNLPPPMPLAVAVAFPPSYPRSLASTASAVEAGADPIPRPTDDDDGAEAAAEAGAAAAAEADADAAAEADADAAAEAYAPTADRSVGHLLTSASDPDLRRAVDVLLDVESHPPGSLPPDVLDSTLRACVSVAHRRTYEAAEAVEAMVRRVEDERVAGCEKVLPWRNLYAVAIDAWAKSGHPDAARRAESVLESTLPPPPSSEGGEAEEDASASASSASPINPHARPNVVAYNSVINAYAKAAAAGDRDAPKNAERILRRMEESYEESRRRAEEEEEASAAAADDDNDDGEEGTANGGGEVAATAAGGGASSVSGVDAAASRTTSPPPVRPNTISYTSVIDAYAQSYRRGAASDAERVFRRMERAHDGGNSDAGPNARSFNAVINAWVKGGGGGKGKGCQRAEEILRRMIDLHCEGDGDEDGGGDVEPTVVSFTTVINGWAKSKEDGSAGRALRVFRLMDELRESGKISARPNAFTYSSLIDALVRSGDLRRAEAVFDRMVDGYAEDPDNAAVPNAVQATQIASAWATSAHSDSGVRAERLLTRLEGLYDEYGEDVMRPNHLTYAAAINAWAKSRSFGKARRAASVLRRMRDAYGSGNDSARPTVRAYTSVLNACAFTVGDGLERAEALRIAAATYGDLCRSTYGSPNHVTYATFLRVCSNLIPGEGDARAKSMASVFGKCRDDGCVDDLVLRVLRSGLTDEQLGEALLPYEAPAGGTRLSARGMPPEWSRKVVAVGRGGRRGANGGDSERRSSH